MDAQTFLNSFDKVAEAPGGTDQLRETIVAMAMQGKLVRQSADEVSASTLLAQITQERERRLDGRPQRRRRRELPPRELSVPTGWESTDLGSVVDLDYGKSLPAKVRQGHGTVPVFGSNGVVGYHDEELVAAPCVIVGRKGSSGAVNVSRVPSWPIDTTYFIVPYAGMSVEFLSLMLSSLHLDRLDRATAVPGLNREDAYSVPVALPPVSEQERIVAKVTELMQLCDDLEARLKARLRTMDSLRRSSFNALTAPKVDGDVHRAWSRISTNWAALTDRRDGTSDLRKLILQLAVEGQLAEADADNPPAAQLLQTIDSGVAIGAAVEGSQPPHSIPGNWTWVHLETVCSHIIDCLHKTPKYTDEGYPAIRTSDIEPGRILIEKARRVDAATFEERTSRLEPIAGDVLYSREGGRFGIAAVVPEGTRLCLGQRMMQFRCAPGIEPEYICYFLNSPLGFGQATADVGGSASPHVNIRAIRKFLVPLPPTAEQRRIVANVGKLTSLVDNLEARLEARDHEVRLLSLSLASRLASPEKLS